MSYLDDLRRGILQSALRTNDEHRNRTHVKVFVGVEGEEPVTLLSNNLKAFVKREVLMTVEDDSGELKDVYGFFIQLSLGSKAAKIIWDKHHECYVHFTLNQSPASARFHYGSIVRIFSPDVPMSDILLGLLFRAPNEESEEPDPSAANELASNPKMKKPALKIVK